MWSSWGLCLFRVTKPYISTDSSCFTVLRETCSLHVIVKDLGRDHGSKGLRSFKSVTLPLALPRRKGMAGRAPEWFEKATHRHWKA